MGWCIKYNQICENTKRVIAYDDMVWSDIRLVKAKFRSQSIRKPDLNNIKIIIVTYFMLQIKNIVINIANILSKLACL